MNHVIPSYIEERIRARPLTDINIIRGSTPVIAFGNAQTSRVATLGLNPSKLEFLDRDGTELTGAKRRLETFNSLGIKDRENINDRQVEQIWEACNQYFENNPYSWFGKLEKVLKYFNVSYYSGTASHLDLVQWATDPVWSHLPRQMQAALVEQDRLFLSKQLCNENIEVLLLNGRSVINEFNNSFDCNLEQHTKLEEGKLSTEIYKGYLFDKIKVLGWSINPQSSFGVTNTFIETIAQIVSKL